jgi:hypothetical protein
MAYRIEFPRLLWYQKPVIESLEDDVCKYVTFLASRRIGKSLIAKCWAVSKCVGEKCNVGFIVPTGDLARKFIREIVENLRGSGVVSGSNTVDKFIAFKNGSLLYFHSAEAWGRGAGNYKYLIADETAFMDTETWQAIFQPWTLEAKKVLFISTPCGVGGIFYEMYNKGLSECSKRYVSYKCTLEESGLYDEETIKEIKDTTPARIYAQEYMCEFISGGISAFGNYEARLTSTPGEATNTLYAGIDFSGANSGTDSTVLTVVNERFETVLCKSYQYGNTKTLEEIAHTLSALKVKHCYAEENSMGAISIEVIKNAGFKNVSGFITTNESKRNIVEFVIRNFEQGKGTIPNDQVTKVQFGNFIMDYTKSGKVTYRNANDNLHDDRVISYCLASWCAKQFNKVGIYCLS